MDEVKDNLYAELNNIIIEVPNTDKLIILGDFNARAGQDHMARHNRQKHSPGGQNSNGHTTFCRTLVSEVTE